jgi:hypothetical protein
MTTKTKKPAASKKPAPVAKRTATGKTPTEAASKLDFAGLAKEAAAKMKGKKGAAPLLGEHPVPAAKSEPAPGATKKTEGKPAAKREVIANDAKLTALFKDIPGKPGSVVYKTRALYLKSKTVGEWREAARAADLDPGYLHGDIRRGLIRVG